MNSAFPPDAPAVKTPMKNPTYDSLDSNLLFATLFSCGRDLLGIIVARKTAWEALPYIIDDKKALHGVPVYYDPYAGRKDIDMVWYVYDAEYLAERLQPVRKAKSRRRAL